MATQEKVFLQLSPQDRILLDALRKAESLNTDEEAFLFALRKAVLKPIQPSGDHGFLSRWRETTGIPPAARPELSVKDALGDRFRGGSGSGSAGGSDGSGF